MRAIRNTKRRIVIGGAAALVIIIIATILIVPHLTGEQKQPTTSSTPTFASLLPKGTSIDTLGGWQKGASPSGDIYYSYKDAIDGVTILVSQQLLPGSASELQKRTTEIAQGYHANRTLPINNPIVYIGASAKGQQSVIFTKNKVLVLIASEDTIKDASWVSYIESLE